MSDDLGFGCRKPQMLDVVRLPDGRSGTVVEFLGDKALVEIICNEYESDFPVEPLADLEVLWSAPPKQSAP